MTISKQVPFSARNRGAHGQVDRDFPRTGRIALVHLLHELVSREYVASWIAIANELGRIARIEPETYDHSTYPPHPKARRDAEETLMGMAWEKVFDFCERLHSYLSREVWLADDNLEHHVTTARSQVQLFIAEELQRLFLEEGLAFEFRDGIVHRRGRRHTVERFSRAEVVLGDPRLGRAREHFDKALRFFRDPSKPDFENAVKEAVCAVEAAGKALFPEANTATLGDLAKWLTRGEGCGLPKTLGRTIEGLYGFRSGGDGVSHGGSSGGQATISIAEYALAVTASQIILLVDLAAENEPDIPF